MGCHRTRRQGSPRPLGPLTGSFLGAKVELQVEVFHHVAQLIIVRVLPELRGRGRFRVSNSTGSWTVVPHCPPPSEGGPGRSRRENLHQAPGMNPGTGREETAGGAIDKSSKLSGDEPAPLVVNNTQTWNTLHAEASKLHGSRGYKGCKGAGATQGGFRRWPRGPGLL